MHYRHILVPFDGSDHSQAAFTTARSLALLSKETTISVVNIVPMDVVSSLQHAEENAERKRSLVDQNDDLETINSPLDSIKEEIYSIIRPLYDELDDSKIHVDVIACTTPAEGIEEYSSDHNCDLIVMGRRGVGAIRGMLGSVSYAVLRNVRIPVLTVK